MASAVSPVPKRATMLRVALALLAVHGLAFSISALVDDYADKAPWRQLYEAGSFLPLQLASMLALLVASRRVALPEPTRRGLRLLGFAFGAVALGSVVWLAMETRGTPLAYISWADLIFFQFYPLIVLGLLSLPTAERATDLRRDTLGWIVVMIVFGSLIAFGANVEAQSRALSTGLRAIVILTGSAQLITLMVINRTIERARSTPSAHAVTLLLGALTLSIVADLGFQVLFSTGYGGRNWSILSAVVTNLLVLTSAIRFLEDPIASADRDESGRISFSPLPIIAVSALALMLVWMAGRSDIRGLGPLLIGLVIVNALVVLREVRASRAAAEFARLAAQRDATRRVEALVRHATDAILLVGGEGRLLFASAPADRLFGVPLSTFLGRTFESALPEGLRPAWRSFLEEISESEGWPVTCTVRLTSTSADARIIECVGLDLREESAVGGLVIHSRDITDRALLEDRLRQSQKLEVAGRLAGGVAHDFNNVLTAVMAGTELAQMSLEPGHPARQDLDGVEAAAQRGAALTRRLLAFVRQEPVPPQIVDLRATLIDLELLLRRLAGEANLVSVVVPEVLGTVRVDRTEFEHIIFNLVANARDATPMGGPIEVRADLVDLTEAPAGSVIAPPPGRYARIAVTDRGHGMADDVRRRMFDPFFTQKTGGRGTGLGLIGVRPLVEGARGGLTVESSSVSGTRVEMYLPCEAAGSVPAIADTEALAPARRTSPTRAPVRTPVRTPVLGSPAATVGGSSAGASTRILLVEDELPVREQLIRLLDALGYSSIAVPSAADARAVLTRDPRSVSAVVSDVMMPGETGIEFANWLRTNHPQLPILLISGHTGTALDREARSSQDFDLLRKPFTSAALAERLEAMLEPRPGGAAGPAD